MGRFVSGEGYPQLPGVCVSERNSEFYHSRKVALEWDADAGQGFAVVTIHSGRPVCPVALQLCFTTQAMKG